MGEATETTFPFLVIEQGQQHFPLSEVGPESFRKIQLGIGKLPKEEIADSHFPACADQQVRVRKIGCGEVLLKLGFMDGAGHFAALHVFDQLVRSVENFGPSSIAQSNTHGPVGERSGLPGNGMHDVLNRRRERVDVANGKKPHFPLMKGLTFPMEEFFKERHEQIYLDPWPIPVFLREGIDRGQWNLQQTEGMKYFSQGRQSFFMPGNARQVTLRRPTSVPVHNHGHMTGKGIMVEL